MKQVKWLWIMGVFLCGLATTNASLQLSVATDKSVYHVGETVKVFITVYNSGTKTMALSFPTAEQATYILDSTFDLSSVMRYATIPTGRSIAPSTSYTWTFTHANDAIVAYPLTGGIHSVVGEIVGYGQSDPIEFQVVNPEPATILLLSSGFLLLRKKK